jgi:shikimate kinase
MVTLVNSLEAEGVFDRDAIRLLAGAFDDAWQQLMAGGAQFTDERQQEMAREIIAKHIIQLARLGERDQRKLTESALLELANSKPAD